MLCLPGGGDLSNRLRFLLRICYYAMNISINIVSCFGRNIISGEEFVICSKRK